MPPTPTPDPESPARGARSDERARPGFGQETDNTAKYAGRSGVERLLLDRFRSRVLDTLRPLAPSRILDAGCGEGHVTGWLAASFPHAEITALDGRAAAVALCRERNPGVTALEGDLYDLPFDEDAFELVVSTEVLEHLTQPATALRELARVSSNRLFLTVPHEPFFRFGNMAAGRYLSRWGSTPGHLSTWNRRRFVDLVATEATPERWLSLFPWQAVLARPRGRA